jgi:hypothetical protein
VPPSVPLIAPRYLRTPDAATHLGLSPRTLEKHRCYGTGPLFRRLGGRVVYAIEELGSLGCAGYPAFDLGSWNRDRSPRRPGP